MSTVRVLVVRSAGTNCDGETVHAFEHVGATVERRHIRQLLEQPAGLGPFAIVVFPGGFSYGDDIAAGRILAVQVRRGLFDALSQHVDRGRGLIGICNGFQVLVQAGMLPWRVADAAERRMSVTANEPAGFQDRWIALRAGDTPSLYLEPGRVYEMPIAHGEGRVAFSAPSDLETLRAQRLAALTYCEPPDPATEAAAQAPANPNGSTADLAGVCDPTGRVLGLMPHPERFVTWTQHPRWTSLPARPEGDGLAIFRRAVAAFR